MKKVYVKIKRGRRNKSLPYRKIPNNLCRYSTFKDTEHNPPLLKCGICRAASFQRRQYGKEGKRVILQYGNLTDMPQPGDGGQR